MDPNTNVVLRYTDIPSVIDMLANRRITLLDPRKWEDKNDTAFLEIYRKRRGLSTLLALCLTETQETFHHWRVFSSGNSGACVVFKKERLLKAFGGVDGIRTGKVQYRKIEELELSRPRTQSLPYLKRHPYRDEKEFRIIYGAVGSEEQVRHFPIDLECIRRVVLSPQLHLGLTDAIRRQLRNIEGCGSLSITRTTLLDNPRWQKLAKRIEDG